MRLRVKGELKVRVRVRLRCDGYYEGEVKYEGDGYYVGEGICLLLVPPMHLVDHPLVGTRRGSVHCAVCAHNRGHVRPLDRRPKWTVSAVNG